MRPFVAFSPLSGLVVWCALIVSDTPRRTGRRTRTRHPTRVGGPVLEARMIRGVFSPMPGAGGTVPQHTARGAFVFGIDGRGLFPIPPRNAHRRTDRKRREWVRGAAPTPQCAYVRGEGSYPIIGPTPRGMVMSPIWRGWVGVVQGGWCSCRWRGLAAVVGGG